MLPKNFDGEAHVGVALIEGKRRGAKYVVSTCASAAAWAQRVCLRCCERLRHRAGAAQKILELCI
jgi:hypothetical protein